MNALYTILNAMKSKRIFDRFGFNLTAEVKTKHCPSTLLENFREFASTQNYIHT